MAFRAGIIFYATDRHIFIEEDVLDDPMILFSVMKSMSVGRDQI